MVKERPILFSTPMVRAILDGRKTQTRRVVKGVHRSLLEGFSPEYVADDGNYPPYGQVGNVLWVRETWSTSARGWIYKADNPNALDNALALRWKPSIFMPKKACRLRLLIKSIRIERLQKITEEDALAEGVYQRAEEVNGGVCYLETARYAFRTLWDSINGKGSWDNNPWVWVIEFERL